MRSNGLLKWLTVPFVFLVVFAGVRIFRDPTMPPHPAVTEKAPASELTPREMEALGIEGDTPEDTVATLVAQVKQMRTELSNAISTNKQSQADNERLRLRDRTIDERIESAVAKEREQRQRAEALDRSTQEAQTQSLFDEFRSRLEGKNNRSSEDLPVGFGLPEDNETSISALHWIEPQDAAIQAETSPRRSPEAGNRTLFPTSFAPAADSPADSVGSTTQTLSELRRTATEIAAKKKPVYTVPSDATLTDAVAMTALIGRIPVDGTVVDPFPFKVVIGPDNLTANGIELPELAGAIVSGTASGDSTLSCVRGEIKSMTFVFRDNTIATSRTSSGRSSLGGGTQGSLGYISDPYGLPCVSGLKRSNAQEYLTTQMLITAAGAGAASLIDSTRGNFSYVTGSNGQTLGSVGITGNEALERILAGGVQEMSQWANKLYGQAFAAVYVPPLAKVAVHIEEPIEIDHDTSGRKVKHFNGDSHASDLE